MKLKGKTKKPDGTEVEAWAEIVQISIVDGVASYGVHLYYYDDGKQKYQPIDKSFTKRYDFELDGKKVDIYEYGYTKLLTTPKFKDFVIAAS